MRGARATNGTPTISPCPRRSSNAPPHSIATATATSVTAAPNPTLAPAELFAAAAPALAFCVALAARVALAGGGGRALKLPVDTAVRKSESTTTGAPAAAQADWLVFCWQAARASEAAVAALMAPRRAEESLAVATPSRTFWGVFRERGAGGRGTFKAEEKGRGEDVGGRR